MPRGISRANFEKGLNKQLAFREANMQVARTKLSSLRRKLTLKLKELEKKGIKSPERTSQARRIIRDIRDEQAWHDHNDYVHQNMTLGLAGTNVRPASKEEKVLFKRGVKGVIIGPIKGRTNPSRLRKKKQKKR
jgi:hypothetical protein